MRFLLITLEFSAGTFSGNGIYGRSQVRRYKIYPLSSLVEDTRDTAHLLGYGDASKFACAGALAQQPWTRAYGHKWKPTRSCKQPGA